MTSGEDSSIFFAKPAAFRAWLEKHHQIKREQWVGFHRKASGRPSITWPEAVDEALCFGWIDGFAQGHRCRELQNSLYPASADQQLERDQHSPYERAYARASRSTCWDEGFSETSGGEIGHLQL